MSEEEKASFLAVFEDLHLADFADPEILERAGRLMEVVAKAKEPKDPEPEYLGTVEEVAGW